MPKILGLAILYLFIKLCLVIPLSAQAPTLTPYLNFYDTALSQWEAPLKMPVFQVLGTITGYSSSPDECWGDPFITADGSETRKGIVANNCYFGHWAKIDGVIYEITDKMNERYGCEYFDKWFPTKEEALEWGVKQLKVKIYK